MREEMSKMKKIHENYTGTIARMDDEGNLEFDFCDDFGAHAILGEYDPAEARALADAIYAELGLGWMPYPENVPETDKYYLVTIDDVFNGIYVDAAQYIPAEDAWYSWDGIIKKEDGNEVVAYRELSAPYQP